MSKKVLLCTEKPFTADAVQGIETILKEAKYELVKLEKYKEQSELLAAIADVDAMIIRSDKIGPDQMAPAAKLKLIVRAGAGVDNINLKEAYAKNITCMNTPGANANAVAELAFGMVLTSIRNHYDGSSGFELRGRSLALYGFGAVARAVHQVAKGFGMNTFAYDPYIPKEKIAEMGATPVDTVAGLFDYQYVSLHVPLTPETKDSINKALLGKMPKGGTLINTARPEVVHEAEMLELIKERSDFCYLSDVPPKNSDEIKKAVGDGFGKRVIFTKKKMGAQTLEANNNAGVAAANQIISFFETGVAKFKVNK